MQNLGNVVNMNKVKKEKDRKFPSTIWNVYANCRLET